MDKLRFLIFGLACLLAHSAFAGGPPNQHFWPNTVGASSYSGPLDVYATNVKACFSLFGCSKAYSTGSNYAMQVQRADNSATMNIKVLANGSFDTNTASAFCSGTTCGPSIWYDQSGTNACSGPCNITSSLPNQYQLLFNCNGLLPCIYISGANTGAVMTLSLAISQPLTYSYVGQRNGTLAYGDIVRGATTDAFIRYDLSANTLDMYAGSGVSGTVSDNAWHEIQAVFNGAVASPNNSALNIDGADTSVNPGTNGVTSPINIGNGGGEIMTGYIDELIFYGGVVPSASRTALCHSQYTRWNTGASC